MKIRDAVRGDAEEIAAYWNPLIRDTTITFTTLLKDPAQLAEDIETCVAGGRAFLVACDDGAVLGHATYGAFRSGPGYARTMEHTVILSPEARGRGVAQKLMAALENHAQQSGIHSLMAGISGDNHRAVKFHENLGYRHVGTVPEVGYKFGRWLDLVLMQKLL